MKQNSTILNAKNPIRTQGGGAKIPVGTPVKERRYEGSKMGGVAGTTLLPLHFHVFFYLFCFALDLHGSSIDLFLPAK